jgi:hypothetical protein
MRHSFTGSSRCRKAIQSSTRLLQRRLRAIQGSLRQCDKWAAASKSASAKIRLALPENSTASTYSFNKGKKRNRDEFMFGVASAAAAGGDSSDDDFCAQKATALEAVKDASPSTGGVLPAE